MSRAEHLATISREFHPQPTKLAVIDRAMAGMSYSQISEDLGIPRGVVSGVVYRARRNGEIFPNQKSDEPPPAAKAYARKIKVEAPKARLVTVRPTPPPEPTTWFPKRLTIMQLREISCRWPLWASNARSADKFYCGLDAVPGSAYCSHCRAKSETPRYTKDIDRKLNLKKLARLS